MNWLKKYKEIADGWYFDAFPTDAIINMADLRAKECSVCPLNKNNECSTTTEGLAIIDFIYQDEQRYKGNPYPGCGCPLSKKTKSPTSKCPLGKW